MDRNELTEPTPFAVVHTRIGWTSYLPLASAIFSALLLILCIHLFARTVAVLVLSVTIADCFAPIADFLQRKRRMSRVLAATIVYACLVGIVVGLIILVAPKLVSEVMTFIKNIPQIINGVQDRIRQFAPGFSMPSGFNGSDFATFVMQHAGSLPVSVFESAITGALIFFLSFYWLVATPDVHNFARSLFPQRLHGDIDRFMDDVGSAMGGYLRGVGINACIVGTLIWIGLHIAGIEYAFPLAVIAGLGEFIPYLGPIISAIPAIAVAALQSPAKVIEAPIIYLAVMQIEGHVLTPNIMRSQTNVPQVVVIVALFAGGTVGGVLGALVAVPVAGAFIVVVKRLIAPLIRRWSAARFAEPRRAAAANGGR